MTLEHRKKLHRALLWTIAGAIVVSALAVSFVVFGGNRTSAGDPSLARLPVITAAELLRHDGTDPSLPIYIGLDGQVYDVTAGKEYYAPGGRYHNIAGTDASVSLHIYGGDIIREKYPIIGVLENPSK